MDTGSIKAVAFDLDGTICMGNQVVPGALEFVGRLKESGIRVLYCTNSSAASRSEIFWKLSALGIELSPEDVYSSSLAAGAYAFDKGFRTVYCLGSPGLACEIRSNGVSVTDRPFEAEALVVGLDKELTYGRISDLVAFRGTDIHFIACNRDLFYPVEGGRLLPGCGLMVDIVEKLLGKAPDVVVGKPNPYLLERMSRDHGLAPGEILVIGDSVESDIAAARTFGSPSILLSPSTAPCPESREAVRGFRSFSGRERMAGTARGSS